MLNERGKAKPKPKKPPGEKPTPSIEATSENVMDFDPAWQRVAEDTSGWGEIFDADVALNENNGFLPITVNNDGELDGTDVVLLALDTSNPNVGFSRETYLISERLDSTPNPVDDSGLNAGLRIDQSNYPELTPRLMQNNGFAEAVVVIEDAQAPQPILLSRNNDTYSGSDSLDVIYAGAGADLIRSGKGNDTVLGDTGRDGEANTPGNDTLRGGEGHDILLGEGGNDQVWGREGDDYLNGGSGNDALNGELGNDELDGMMGNDSLSGGSGGDALYGGHDNDSLYGGSGSDTLNGETGDDYLEGGTGNDTYIVDSTSDNIVDTPRTGIETVEAPITWSLDWDPGLDHLILTGENAIDGYGNYLSNFIIGNVASNTLMGEDGNDTLVGDPALSLSSGAPTLINPTVGIGSGSSDTLNGGNGDDTLIGLDETDWLTGGAGADRFVFATNSAYYDRAYSDASTEGIDQITDFDSGEGDKLIIPADKFNIDTTVGLTPGILSAEQFTIGTAATAATHRFIYDSTTGALSFDRDGSGLATQKQIAWLSPGLSLTSSDIVVTAE